MGADFSSYAIIGLRVDPDDLFINEKVKTFEHNYSQDMLFDPKTGKELWKVNSTPIEGYNGEDEFRDYKVVYDTDGQYNYICLYAADEPYSNGGPYSQMIPLPNNDEWIIKLGIFREQLSDLWDEAEFGLWSILYCSY